MASIQPASDMDFDDPGPGVHVLVHPDPASIGEEIAGAIEGRLVMGGVAAVAALPTIRADRSAEAGRAPAPEDPLRLRGMAESLQRADRIEDDTRLETAVRLAESLSTDVTVHPESLRRAAAELTQAELTLERARLQVPPPARTEVHEPRALNSTTGPTVLAVGVCVLGLAAGGALAIAGAPAWGGLVIVLMLVLAAVIRRRLVAEGRTDDSDRVRASEVLAHAMQLGQAPEPAASAPSEPPFNAEAVADAEAELATAHRRWELLAGVGVDPSELEQLIRRQDPQHDLIASLVPEVPVVRATARFAQTVRDRWKAAWSEIGEDPPDPPRGVALDDALERVTRRVPERVGQAAVLVEPFAGLSTNDAWLLKQDLLALDPQQTVILVVASEEHVPA
ncbi:MAG: hypothetical protein JWN46_404 [Acidimicrobiales bacterium]|nr:hypothetical protein [Acidimicrobiales bacterium]